jgi:ribosomal protein L32
LGGLRGIISLTTGNIKLKEGVFFMGKPKKRTSSRRTGMRRSHLVIKLARRVNAKSPVKVYEKKKQRTAASASK